MLPSCSQESTMGSKIGRGVMAVGTLGMSEWAIENKKSIIKQACLDAGLEEGTKEYIKCFVDLKKAQLSAASINTNVDNR